MIYKFTRNFDGPNLKRVISEHDFPQLTKFKVVIGGDGSISEDNIEIEFLSDLSALQQQDLMNIMTAPELSALTKETDITVVRQADGFALYQKIFSDLSVAATLSSVDETISVYPYLQTIRCLLKDGMGETALRYLIKHIVPLNIFSTKQIDDYKLWIRDFCQKYRPISYDTTTYDSILTMIETEVSI